MIAPDERHAQTVMGRAAVVVSASWLAAAALFNVVTGNGSTALQNAGSALDVALAVLFGLAWVLLVGSIAAERLAARVDSCLFSMVLRSAIDAEWMGSFFLTLGAAVYLVVVIVTNGGFDGAAMLAAFVLSQITNVTARVLLTWRRMRLLLAGRR